MAQELVSLPPPFTLVLWVSFLCLFFLGLFTHALVLCSIQIHNHPPSRIRGSFPHAQLLFSPIGFLG